MARGSSKVAAHFCRVETGGGDAQQGASSTLPNVGAPPSLAGRMPWPSDEDEETGPPRPLGRALSDREDTLRRREPLLPIPRGGLEPSGSVHAFANTE